MGNVLLDYNPKVPLDAFVENEEGRNIIRRELFEGPEWVRRDLGTISREEQFARVCERIPEYLHEQLKRCVYEWEICMVPIPGAGKFCADMKEKGYGLYVLSNASETFYEYFPDFMALEEFDGIVVSADIHIIKPDKKIYQYLLDKYELHPGECLFIDDRADNVEGAKSVGMHGVIFENNFEEIRRKFKL